MPGNIQKKIVLSASRRTDIPAFYMPWFMDAIEKGEFKIENPYNGRTTQVPATPETVHTIVFWSKDFGPFLQGGYGEDLAARGYHLFFNFTVNSHCPELEPGVPPLDLRLDQLGILCKRFSPGAVLWRFDPVCFYNTPAGPRNNLGDFGRIALAAAGFGIERCVTSFLDLYPKIQRRTGNGTGISFFSPSLERQKNTLLQLQAQLEPLGIALFTCCEKELLETLPLDSGILPSACIPGRLLTQLYGGGISLRKDSGQRAGAGCGCTVSSDIGSYRAHPCRHDCLFCYANPAAYRSAGDRRQKTPAGSGT
jgi:hypothetical protein